MRIAVFGLGYVGVVNLACFAKLGHQIYGCDIKSQKVDAVLKGRSPINEPRVTELISAGISAESIHASTDAKTVIENTDLALICVGTPSGVDGSVNLNYTINTTVEIARYLKNNPKPYTIIYRSTVPPGTIENYILPEFKKILGKQVKQINVCFLPEFLREGTAVQDFYEGARIVIGTDGSEPADVYELFNYSESIPIVFTDYKTAEFIKYVDNTFHALKVSFANEVYSVGTKLNVDIEVANEVFLMDTQLNISPYYLKAGMPFGGSCLPKDVRAINYMASVNNIKTPLIGNILASNDAMYNRVVDEVKSFGLNRILVCGLTFKKNTDDVRESPYLRLVLDLAKQGYNIGVYDRDINLITLRIEQAEVVKYVEEDLVQAMKNYDLLVCCKDIIDQLGPNLDSSRHVILNCANQRNYDLEVSVHNLY